MTSCCEGKELIGPYKTGGYIVHICEGCGAWKREPMAAKIIPQKISMPKKARSHGLPRKGALAQDGYVREP